MASFSFLDPVLIAKLGNLEIRARRILDGMYSGRHANRLRGASQEFSEHRPYHPGDDLRRLDWKILGKTNRLVIKQFDEETSVASFVIFDNSSSMGFQSGGPMSKMEYGKTMAAALGYLLTSQQDAVGLISRGAYLPPQTQRHGFQSFLSQLDTLTPNGVWEFSDLLGPLGIPLKKKSLLLVFSDLMHDANRLVSVLRTLQSHKHEILVIQILDPHELELPYSGSLLIEDVETGETVLTDPEIIRASYQQYVRKEIERVAHVLKSSGIEHLFLTTTTPFDRGLGMYLSWRSSQ